MAEPLKEKTPSIGSQAKGLASILIVDDEESICSTLAGVLEDENYETAIAHRGEEAVEKVIDLKPDLVFLDIWMPDWDGIQTLECIKEVSPETEVIMISGHATIQNALEATKRGAFDFIEKPLDIDSVLLSVDRALERKGVSSPSSSAASSSLNDRASQREPLLKNLGVCSKGMAGANIRQRTLARSVILYGQCLHSGIKSGLLLEPLPANSGIHFSRIGDSKVVPSFVDHVTSTGFATTVRGEGGVSASTIEHLLAALHAYGVSNLLIKCNGEVPIFDGSSSVFCQKIEEVGLTEQDGDWFEIAPDKSYEWSTEGGQEILLEPSDCLEVDYQLSYPEPVGDQSFYFKMDGSQSFAKDISRARTFGFMKDIERLQKAGLAAGGRLDNFIMISEEGVVNTELRYPEELARHKILDFFGDIFLLGRPLRAKITARMTGHSDNIELAKLMRDEVLA